MASLLSAAPKYQAIHLVSFSGPDSIAAKVSDPNMADLHPPPVLAHILPPSWEATVVAWLEEDTPSFDWGGYVVGEVEREAFLLGKGKTPAVLAGVPFVDKIFSHLGCQ